VAWYAYTNADFLVAGRFLGAATLGAYTFAWNIASVPVEKVSSLVARVTPAFFARLRDDNAGLGRMLINVTDALAFITLPASLGLAVVADDLVPALLGPGWSEAILPLQILAFYASFRSLCTLLPQILTIKGDTRFLMWNGLLTAIILPVGFWIGSRWGGAGIAAGWVTVYPLFVFPLYRKTLGRIGLSLGAYLKVIWPSLWASVIMAAAVFALKLVLPASWTALGRLLAQASVGAAVFGLIGYLPQRARIRKLRGLLFGGGEQRPATLAQVEPAAP
jgi:PST family polysaccharide transporter